MHISIHAPTGFSEKGNRENNEDFRFPSPENLDANQQVFVVCDGVGGAKKGEVASQMVATAFGEYLTRAKKPAFEENDFTGGIAVAQTKLETYLEQHPSSSGMGTTLVSLCLHRDGASVVWVGDSRLYQVRKGRIVFKTTDHTLVNEWLRQGIISPEAAATHPQRKVITRALQGRLVNDTQPEVTLLQDVMPGDVFFLCSDGVHEEVSDDEMAVILSSSETDGEKIERLRRRIEQNPNDNFTGTIVTVREVTHTGSTRDFSGRSSLQPVPAAAGVGAWQPAVPSSRPVAVEAEEPFLNLKNMGILAGALIALIFLSIAFLGGGKAEPVVSPEKKEVGKPAINQIPTQQPTEPENIRHSEPRTSGGAGKNHENRSTSNQSNPATDLAKEGINVVVPPSKTPVGTAGEVLKNGILEEKNESDRKKKLKKVFEKKDGQPQGSTTGQPQTTEEKVGPEPLPSKTPTQEQNKVPVGEGDKKKEGGGGKH